MVNLKERSSIKELLDDDDIPFADIKQNMKELNTINTFLGGHGITLAGVKRMLKQLTANNLITICEIGCGGGDNLRAINNWCIKNKIQVQLIGIDIKKECIDFAKLQCAHLDAKWIHNDYATVSFGTTKPDIIFSSLFCHHFSNADLVKMLNWMKLNCSKGFFINDLHRHPLAYYSIRWITQLFSSSYLVKNDAPLSVARSFVRNEWHALFDTNGIKNYTIQWKWAFRFLIIYSHE